MAGRSILQSRPALLLAGSPIDTILLPKQIISWSKLRTVIFQVFTEDAASPGRYELAAEFDQQPTGTARLNDCAVQTPMLLIRMDIDDSGERLGLSYIHLFRRRS